MLRYIKGDLFSKTNKSDVIAHSVNCVGAFGAGVAAGIAKHYPRAKALYLEKFHRKGWELGEVQMIKINQETGDIRYVANMSMQYNVGAHNKPFDYNSCELCLNKLFKRCYEENYSISMPKIGAGFGGGDWNRIEPIILSCLKNYEVNLEIYVI